VFDLQHSKCPNDGHEMQVQNMTVMPSAALTEQEHRTSPPTFVTLRKKEASSYPMLLSMDDPS